MPAWCRWYSEVLNDRKIKRIMVVTSQAKATIVGCWATILALANNSGERGTLSVATGFPLTLAEIAEEFGLPESDTQRVLDAMIQLGMLHQDGEILVVSHFRDRNFSSDVSTLRVRRYRARCNVSGPLQEQQDAVSETDIAEDNRTEQNRAEQSRANETAAAAEIGYNSQGQPIGIADYEAVVGCYENNIGLVTQIMGENLQDAVATYPTAWILDAIGQAVAHEKRSWSYILAILARWRREGRGPPVSSPAAPIGLSPDQQAAYARKLEAHSGNSPPR